MLLVQGDDDRNVQFSQLTGLVQLLRAHNVYHEVIVFTDDTHEPLLHRRYLYVFNRLEEFIGRYLKGTPARSTRAASSRCGAFWLTLFAIGAGAVLVFGWQDGVPWTAAAFVASSCPGCGGR